MYNVCKNLVTFDSNKTDDENVIVSCLKCRIKVHQKCYGVEAKEKMWLCSFCRSGTLLKSLRRKCELCTQIVGPLKATTNKRFVHVICALFHPGCAFSDKIAMEPISISRVPTSVFKMKCYYCIERKKAIASGATVKCSTKQCKKCIHVTCAQLKKCLREEDNAGMINFKLYCEV